MCVQQEDVPEGRYSTPTYYCGTDLTKVGQSTRTHGRDWIGLSLCRIREHAGHSGRPRPIPCPLAEAAQGGPEGDIHSGGTGRGGSDISPQQEDANRGTRPQITPNIQPQRKAVSVCTS